jgi:hypothetical protein
MVMWSSLREGYTAGDEPYSVRIVVFRGWMYAAFVSMIPYRGAIHIQKASSC